MLKNFIISGLLIFILSQQGGWALQGMGKIILCIVLTILIGIVITLIEEIINHV